MALRAGWFYSSLLKGIWESKRDIACIKLHFATKHKHPTIKTELFDCSLAGLWRFRPAEWAGSAPLVMQGSGRHCGQMEPGAGTAFVYFVV